MSVVDKGKVRIVSRKVCEITEHPVSKEQGGYREDSGCVDQIFTVRILVEKQLEKRRKLSAAIIYLEKTYGN